MDPGKLASEKLVDLDVNVIKNTIGHANAYTYVIDILKAFCQILNIVTLYIWPTTRETLSSGFCLQQRRRPACASAQSDQRLCYSLIGKYYI